MFLVCTRCNYARPGRPSLTEVESCPDCGARGETGRLVAAFPERSVRTDVARIVGRIARAVPSPRIGAGR